MFYGCLASETVALHNTKIRYKDIEPQNIITKGSNILFIDMVLLLMPKMFQIQLFGDQPSSATGIAYLRLPIGKEGTILPISSL
jgi:hypothetical protein